MDFVKLCLTLPGKSSLLNASIFMQSLECSEHIRHNEHIWSWQNVGNLLHDPLRIKTYHTQGEGHVRSCFPKSLHLACSCKLGKSDNKAQGTKKPQAQKKCLPSTYQHHFWLLGFLLGIYILLTKLNLILFFTENYYKASSWQYYFSFLPGTEVIRMTYLCTTISTNQICIGNFPLYIKGIKQAM